MNERNHKPGALKPEIITRKERFQEINAFVTARNGWLVSVPGEREVTVEVLVNSTLPDELAKLGYVLFPEGQGERILPSAIIEHFARRADGELKPITAESTQVVAETRVHAGITKVRRYSFDMP